MSDAIELATGYVSLTVSARGIKSEIDKEVGQPLAAAGKKGEKGLTDSARTAGTAHGKNAKLAAAAWAGVGVGLAATAKAAVGEFSKVAGETAKLKRLTGESAEAASKLRYAAERTGLGTDKLAASIKLVSKNAESGKLDDLGVSFKDAEGKARPFTDVLGDLAEVVAKTPEGIERNAVATRIFGKAGTDLLPILANGRKGIADFADEAERYGLVMSDADIDANKAFIKSQRELTAAMSGLKVSLGREVIPLLTDGAKATGVLAEGLGSIPAPIKTAAFGVLGLATAAQLGSTGLKFISGGLEKVTDLAGKTRDGVTGAVNSLRGVASAEDAAAGGGSRFAGALTKINPLVVAGTAALAVGVGIYEAWASASNAAAKAEQENASKFISGTTLAASAQAALQAELSGTRDGTDRFNAGFKASGLILGQVSKQLADGADFEQFRINARGVLESLPEAKDATGFENYFRGFDATNVNDQLTKLQEAAKKTGPGVKSVVDQLVAQYKAGKLTGDQLRTTVDSLAEVSKGYNLAGRDVREYAGQIRDLLKEQGNLTDADKADIATARDTSKSLDDRRAALNRLAEKYPELAKEVGLEDEATRKATAENERHQASLKAIADELDGVTTNLKLQRLEYDKGETMASAYVDAVKRSSPLPSQIQSAYSLSKATKAFLESVGKLPAELDATAIAFGNWDEEQSGAIDTVLQLGDATSNYLSRIVATGDLDRARGTAALLREEYDRQLRARGYNIEQIEQYNELLGLTPDQVNTAISLSGIEGAQMKLKLYVDLFGGKLDEDITNTIFTKIEAGDFEGATKAFEDWRRRESMKTITVQVNPIFNPGSWFKPGTWSGAAGASSSSSSKNPIYNPGGWFNQNTWNGGSSAKPTQPDPRAEALKAQAIAAVKADLKATGDDHLPTARFTKAEIDKGIAAEVLNSVAMGSAGNIAWYIRQRRARFPGFHTGGLVAGAGDGDKVLLRGEPGEFMLRRYAVDVLGAGTVADINAHPDVYAELLAAAAPATAPVMSGADLGAVAPPASRVLHQTNHITMPVQQPERVALELPRTLRAAGRVMG